MGTGSVGLPKSCWWKNFTSLHPGNTIAADFTGVSHCSGLFYEQGLICLCTTSVCPVWLFGCLVIFLTLLFQYCRCFWRKWGHKCLSFSTKRLLRMRCVVWVAIRWLLRKEGAPTLLVWLPQQVPHVVPFSCLLLCHCHTILHALSPSQLWIAYAAATCTAILVFCLFPIGQLLL